MFTTYTYNHIQFEEKELEYFYKFPDINFTVFECNLQPEINYPVHF